MTTALAKRTVALIVAAGKGERLGGELPKQFAMLGDKALVAWSVDRFASHPTITALYVVIGAEQEKLLDVALTGRAAPDVVTGGIHRHESVRAGLEAIANAGGADYVLIHDAARPRLSNEVINRLLGGLETHKAVVPTLPCLDTLSLAGEAPQRLLGTVADRTELVRVQTPQAFHFDAILAAHRQWAGVIPPTDDAQMARAIGIAVAMVPGDAALEKITEPADFARAETLLAGERLSDTRTTRTGFGVDVHRLEAGEELWLCGVRIAHDKGLSGHSDADVALHALTDALLGSISAGDIGSHFPPSDPQWRGAASHRFVAHARDLINARSGVIDHVDITLICEMPRIGPHVHIMRTAVANMLHLPIDRVSIKATTTERLGFTGRGEGIAAQAVASVRV